MQSDASGHGDFSVTESMKGFEVLSCFLCRYFSLISHWGFGCWFCWFVFGFFFLTGVGVLFNVKPMDPLSHLTRAGGCNP